MANPDQKTILYDEAFKELNKICIDFQENSGATDEDVKELLKDILGQWDKF
tara:strand:- start:294 stop:446 length:153 start_codon:yes stop_codon:yes gene_type:complete